MKFSALKSQLVSMGIVPGCEPLSFEEYTLKLTSAKFGPGILGFIQDCFAPDGEPVEPGYEDSLSLYHFEVDSWETLEQEYIEAGL